MTAGKPKRWAMIALAVLGVALIAMPAAFQMFGRAPKGARMIKDFRPYMTAARLSGYQTEMSQIDAGVREASTKVVVDASRLSDVRARPEGRAHDQGLPS